MEAVKTKLQGSSRFRSTFHAQRRVPLALVLILVGITLFLSGLLQHIPVFAAIAASVSPTEPVFNAGQTLLIGLLLIVCGGRLAHS